MLKNLIKYDIKDAYKLLVVFYILALVFALLTRMFFSIEGSLIMNIIAQICSGVTISMLANILINNVMRAWVRFKNNLYKDESYLTHTLPIGKGKIYLAKFLALIITMFTSAIMMLLTLFIAYYSKENLEIVKSILLPIANMYDSSMLGLLLVVALLVLIETITLIQAGFTGIIIGHKFNNKKMALSVLFGFISYMVLQIMVAIGIFLVGLFNENIMTLFTSTEITNVIVLKQLMYVAMAIYAICIAIYYIVNVKLLKKGVNID